MNKKLSKLQVIRTAMMVLIIALFCGCAGQQRPLLHVTTNQQYIEEVRGDAANLEDIEGMFASIFATLPQEVTVYPTENYYYFKFFANHRELWGNMRLDVDDRDEGVLHFAYFEVTGQTDSYFRFARSWYKPLTKHEGVVVEKVAHLSYKVSHGGKSVVFHLNNLAQVVPAGLRLRESEVFISRNCDESGFQFVLVFDQVRKSFRYLLDESVSLPDLLQPYGKDIFVGLRSGFAFYQEPDMGRKLLFAVDLRNVEVNNYFDGPFDQLGDNFVDPAKFQEFLLLAYPFYQGKVKGRGHFVDENGAKTGSRVLVSSYFSYKSLRDLWSRVAACQSYESSLEGVASCIGQDEKDPAYASFRRGGRGEDAKDGARKRQTRSTEPKLKN